MKNFKEFTEFLVDNWRTEKRIILESVGLEGLSNREYGDKAETYILKKVKALIPKYEVYLSKGSQTPADILSVARRNGYWHIMLIQVKSSSDKNTIYKLNEDDKKVFKEFAKFVKSSINKFEPLKEYSDKSIIISTGYSAVLRIENNNKIIHKLIESKAFNFFKKNAIKLDINKFKEIVTLAHKLGK